MVLGRSECTRIHIVHRAVRRPREIRDSRNTGPASASPIIFIHAAMRLPRHNIRNMKMNKFTSTLNSAFGSVNRKLPFVACHGAGWAMQPCKQA